GILRAFCYRDVLLRGLSHFLLSVVGSCGLLSLTRMINFGSAADKLCPLYFAELTSRYTGPPVKHIKSKSEGSLTPVNTVPDTLQVAKPLKRVGSGYRFRKRPSNPKCYGNYNFPSEAYESFYSNWDLIPAAPEKPFPNWDVHKSIPETLARLSPQTLRHLTRHEIVD